MATATTPTALRALQTAFWHPAADVATFSLATKFRDEIAVRKRRSQTASRFGIERADVIVSGIRSAGWGALHRA